MGSAVGGPIGAFMGVLSGGTLGAFMGEKYGAEGYKWLTQ
jgi:hypothetical protein